MKPLRSRVVVILAVLETGCVVGLLSASEPAVGQLHVGWAMVDITPSAPVVLEGSGYTRVTSEVEDPVTIEIHVLRLGDIALVTNPFELFLDYGVRIKGRSRAVLTLISQLTCDHQGYLPTRRAVSGGDYSAVNYTIGPRGGQVLVDESVAAINSLWP